jgi:hypothetical protein
MEDDDSTGRLENLAARGGVLLEEVRADLGLPARFTGSVMFLLRKEITKFDTSEHRPLCQ